MLSLKHCSGPVDPKLKIFFFHLLRGPKIRGGGGGGQMSLGQKPEVYIFPQAIFKGTIILPYVHKKF